MPKCACLFIPNRFRVAKTVRLQLLQLVDAMCLISVKNSSLNLKSCLGTSPVEVGSSPLSLYTVLVEQCFILLMRRMVCPEFLLGQSLVLIHGLPKVLPHPCFCFCGYSSQPSSIGLLLQLYSIPCFMCPPPGLGFEVTTGTRVLPAKNPNRRQWNKAHSRLHSVHDRNALP